MSASLSDTTPEAEQVLIQLLRQAPSWRKFEMVGQLNKTVHTFMWSGLCERYPQASESQLRRYLADLMLGPELAARVYGPLPQQVH